MTTTQRKKLKNLHWEKIPESAVDPNSVWAKVCSSTHKRERSSLPRQLVLGMYQA